MSHPSETSRCRVRLARFCQGFGLDVGFGGDPILPHAITIDMPNPYTSVGGHPQNLGGDCGDLYWFQSRTLDFVFSSHLLEDFNYLRQSMILREWLRVLKRGGRVVLYQPDEQVYRAHCERSGQPYNLAHKEADYSLANFKRVVLPALPASLRVDIIHEDPAVETYSWEIVLQKVL